VKLTWDENKRKSNLTKHGLDFADMSQFGVDDALFGEDTRFTYPERRFVAIGLLNASLVQVVYAADRSVWRIISLRHASRKERKLWREK
jgi:uncharacterized DUF497 family protein